MEQIQAAAALLREGLLTAAEFGTLKRQAIAAGAAARSTPLRLESPAPAAAAAAVVGLRAAKRRAVGAGGGAAAPRLPLLDPALKVRRGLYCQLGLKLCYRLLR